MRLYLAAFATFFVLGCATLGSAYAADKGPEEQATAIFFDMCVLTGGDKAKIDKAMKPLFEHDAAKEVPASELKKSMNVDADYVWLMRISKPTQKLMLTVAPNICALHLNSGDTIIVRREFEKMLDFTAKNVNGNRRIVEKRNSNGVNYTMNAITLPKEPNELAIALSTTEKPAPKGTKHLMTLSVAKREE